MLDFKYIRVGILLTVFVALACSSGASSKLIIDKSSPASVVENPAAAPTSDSIDDNSTYYSVRRDLRRCVSPLCGGYFVKRVNRPNTACSDGRVMSDCYVAEINWNGNAEVNGSTFVVRGNIGRKRFGHFGNLGEMRVSESWTPMGNNRALGTFYRVRDRGVRCITHPCPTHLEAKLNSASSQNIAGVNLASSNLGDQNAAAVTQAMTGPGGVIVTGENVVVRGPGGRSFELRGTQVYLRNQSGSSSMKPCIKTGCSSQVCSDREVITTCEFRPEYACYQKAVCERQSDGNCGFTKTRELTECLARK
ncbi:MAG: DUF6748 domain-containing protein [Acidobacteriota bacterium]